MVSQRKHPFNAIRPKTKFGIVSEHFADLQHVKRSKTCVSGLNELFQSTELVKMVSQRNHPFHFIRPKTIFGIDSQHFADLRHLKRLKTCISGLNALFSRTKLAKMVSQRKHPFYCIRPKTMFGIVSEHFAELQHVKRSKICVSGLNALFKVPNLRKWFRNKNFNSTS